ncbi:uncharacterized protein LOC130217559 [Danio aesculapii]|uniref:uncharacterized protein LOC130217559 n=1 Tax=Danio aesculapii TaxID=1142201 RepID=UPI0024BF51C1|nr:uncharacterized protein LOC130217559 [Danio aesculapii]XP_056305652.1 uncharacterized protein LOC130217559 [Danio aesculapii]
MDSNDVFNTTPTTYWDYIYDDYIFNNSYFNHMIPPYHTSHYTYFNQIRLSIFGIVAVCVGLPCLIWAFYSVHLQRKASGRVSAFIILLLLNDLLQLPLYTYIVSYLLSFVSFDHPLITVVSACLKIIGFHLQSLVALEAALTVKYPKISARMCSWPCYIIISIIVLFIPVMFVFGVVLSGSVVCWYLTYGSFLLPACLLVATGKIIYKAPPTFTDSRPGAAVFAVSLVTLLVLYLPSVMFLIVMFHYPIPDPWLIMTLCLVSFTVISEPLLCVLVCRQNLSAQTKQAPIELNSEYSEFDICQV